ncbi:MAG: heavy-metal-associated domain-containing protein [Bacteroidales bacterium]
MKAITSIALFSIVLLLGGMNPSFSQDTQENAEQGESTFAVLGNCGMCKDRIEKAAYSVRGVRDASWDQQKQELSVGFRPDRATREQVERAVAKAGHDTEYFLADDETYANLHACCLYERDPEMLKNNKRHDEK